MNNALLCIVMALMVLSSCRTKCPAYSSVKPDTQLAAPAMTASHAEAANRQ